MATFRNTDNQAAWQRVRDAAIARSAELLAAGKNVPPATTGTKTTSGGDTGNAGPVRDMSPTQSAIQRITEAAREKAIAAEEKKIRARAEANNREISTATLREMALISLQQQAERAMREREQRRLNDHGRDFGP